jgi:hypothetical protein
MSFKRTKMAKLMKKLMSLEPTHLSKLLQSYMDETLYTACILGEKHEAGKTLTSRDKGKIEFIEHVVIRVYDKIKEGEKSDANQQTPNSSDSCS